MGLSIHDSRRVLGLYQAVTSCVHFGYMLKEVFKIDVFPIRVYGDNKSAIQIATGAAAGTSTKYLETKYHLLKQMVEEKLIIVKYVPTQRNRSDGLTKALGKVKFDKFLDDCYGKFNYIVFNEEMGDVEMRDNMKSVTWKMTSKDVTDGLKQKIEMEQPINQNQKEEMSGDD